MYDYIYGQPGEQDTATTVIRTRQEGLWRRRLVTGAWAVLLTVTQLWALMVVLASLGTPGSTLAEPMAALACVLAGALAAVVSAWRRVRALPSDLRISLDADQFAVDDRRGSPPARSGSRPDR